MGQRANLVIGNSSGYDLFYNHWCANTITRDLFWGPEHALEFVSKQRSVDRIDGWLDTVWAEGGAVVDPNNRTLLIYGGQDVLYDVPLRRLYLKLLRSAWGDWKIRWAYEGIVEIAEYVGVDRSHVIPDKSPKNGSSLCLDPPSERDWVQCIGSMKSKDSLRIYPLNCRTEDYLQIGPDLLSRSSDVDSLPSFRLLDWTDSFPTGGFHIDFDQQQLHYWIAYDCPDVLTEISGAWEGWRVTWHHDKFESQLDLTEGKVAFHHPSEADLLKSLLVMLEHDTAPVDVLEIAQRISQHDGGRKVEINPLALRDDRLALSPEKRKAILERSVASLNE
ncbi:MAG: hypothetical protein U0930_11115 [Pirellulales bacterium]